MEVEATDPKYSALFPKPFPYQAEQDPTHSESGPGPCPATRGFPICWSTADLGWLPYLPAVITYNHPIFTDMNFYPGLIPVEEGFVLDPSAVDHWRRIEFIVQTTADKLFSSSSTPQPLPPFYPSSYGYHQTIPSRQEAKSVIKASVSAFHHALAYCSYAVASLDFPQNTLESLYKDLTGAPCVIQDMITDVASHALLKLLWSTLGEMHRMRNFSGVVVSYDRPCDCQSVRRMHHYGVPVYVRWSHISRSQSYCEFPQREILTKWCPSANYFAILGSDEHQSNSIPAAPPTLHPTPLLPPATAPVDVEDGHPGEGSQVTSLTPLGSWRDVGEFLYGRYGVSYISEVTDANKDSTWSAVLGLCCTPPASLVILYNWVTAGHWPFGICDLSPDLMRNSLLTRQPHNSPIHATRLPGSQGYLISIAEGWNVGWRLIIQDPLTVLQIKREGWADPHDLINGLIKKGAPFRVLNSQALEGSRFYGNPDSTVGLGNEQPREHLTYAAYQQHLRRYFIRHPHAYGAALSAGGILWRIAMDVLPSPNGSDIVRPFHQDLCVSSIMGGREYWTPRLTLLEKDIIVGVYKRIICRFNAADEHPGISELGPREESWWPKPQMWKESGLEFGVWAPLDEEWYTTRALELEEEGGRPVDVREWRSQIRYKRKEAQKFVSCARVLTDKYLRDHRW